MRLLTATKKHDGLIFAGQMALKIPMILEKLVANLNLNDLLTSRQVCLHLNYAACAQIQKRGIKITCFAEYYTNSYTSIKNGNTLQDLMVVMHKNISFFTALPVTTCKFVGGNLSGKYRDLMLFLKYHGNSIKNFSFEYACWFKKASKVQEDIVISQVQHLLLKRIPNIEYLMLEIDINPANDRHDSLPYQYETLEIYDDEFLELHSEEFRRENAKLKNLSIFDYNRSCSNRLFEVIVQMAPNLQEIRVDSDNYNLLIQPLNRLHLCKEFKSFCDDVVFMERIFMFGAENLALTSICLDFGVLYPPPGVYEERLVIAMNSILAICARSLREIGLFPVTVLEDFYWPDIMPNVRVINASFPTDGRDISKMFPGGNGMARLFPKLEELRISLFNDNASYEVLLSCLQFYPVESVSKVVVSCRCYRYSRPFRFPWKYMEALQALFPFAEIARGDENSCSIMF